MDGGYLEAQMMANAGANMVVVMGQSHSETIELVVKAGHDFGVKVMGDIMAMPDPVKGARRLEDLGCDYIIHHIGYDMRTLRAQRGHSAETPLDRLREIVDAVDIPVQAVGGLTIQQAIELPGMGAPMVVIGAPLSVDAHAFKAATGDLEGTLRVICQAVHAYGDVFEKEGAGMSNTMAALVNFAREPLSVEVRDKPIPNFGDSDVLLRVGAVSICGSDLHQWRGSHSWAVNYPCILGHEFAGTVVKAGSSVKHFREGDRVVSETAAVIDESSPLSRAGLYNLDPTRRGFGYGVDGAMTEYVRVPERCLHRIPATLPFAKAALTEPCCVAYNAVCVNGRIRPGDSVLVIGPGPIGLLCTKMAKLSGAGHVIVAGLPSDRRRLQVARQLGADSVLEGGVPEYVAGFGDHLGVDVAIDTSGASVTLQMALQCVRPAGQIIKVGWGPQPMGFSLDPLVQKNITLTGSFSHNWPIWERVIAMIVTGQIDLDPVISRVCELTQWHDCFEKMEAGEYVKAVLTT